MKIIKEELRFEENLKKRLEFICEFSKVTPTFINGSIRKIDKTNISYIEPHRVMLMSIQKCTVFQIYWCTKLYIFKFDFLYILILSLTNRYDK